MKITNDRSFPGEHAFTLIELLVVIAIITILAAILFSVFATAREKARQTECLSNEKSIGLAFTQYNQDYDEQYPNGNTANNGGNGWASQLDPYLKSVGVMACASDPFKVPAYYPYGAQYLPSVISYMYNRNFSGAFSYAASYNNSSAGSPILLSQVVSPGQTVLVYKSKSTYYYPTYLLDTASPSGNGSDGSSTLATGQLSGGVGGGTVASGLGSTPRHNGGSNFLGADGHVKWLVSSNVSAGRNSWTNGNNNAETTSNPCEAEGTVYAGSDKHSMTMSVR